MNASIRAENVGVQFFFDRQRRVMTPTLARLRRSGSSTWGIRGIDFEVGPGEAVALVGPSGSGKSTLLRTLGGVLRPDEGRLEVNGRVASLLSTGAGLMSLLTGRENALLLGVLAGHSRARARALIPQVQARTGLGEEFDHPVSSFSEGMRARLGFAVAEETDPAVLLLDEVHEALDHEFRARVEERARAIVDAGGIVFAAGHDHPILARMCNRAFLLQAGSIALDGTFQEVVHEYLD